MIQKFKQSNTTGELVDRMHRLLQRGIYPLLFWERSGIRIVELDSRDVLSWVEGTAVLPLKQLVGFPCHAPNDHGDFSALEKERLALVTASFLECGYTAPALLTKWNGATWYIDWPNAAGLQFSMGMTDATGGHVRTSLRLVLPATHEYELHDMDERGQMRATVVRFGELPVHNLLGKMATDRAAQLSARFSVHVVGELSQLVSVAHSTKVIQDVCAVFAAFVRAVVAPKYRAQIFTGANGVAFSISAAPKLAETLARVVEARLVPQVAPLARVRLVQVGPPTWRRGADEVPLLLCVHATGAD
jgi:hypothetical protein